MDQEWEVVRKTPSFLCCYFELFGGNELPIVLLLFFLQWYNVHVNASSTKKQLLQLGNSGVRHESPPIFFLVSGGTTNLCDLVLEYVVVKEWW